MLQLRKDPVVDRWIIIASERARRLRMVASPQDRQTGPCPFCPGNEDKTPPEIAAYRPPGSKPNTTGWWTRVVPNKFPALQIEGELDRAGQGIYDVMNGIGAHEVIIDTPSHDDRTVPRPERRRPVPLHPDIQEPWIGCRRIAQPPAFPTYRDTHSPKTCG